MSCIKRSVAREVKGADSAPLLCSGETPHGVLCPVLESSAQASHGPVGAGPEEGHKNDQGWNTFLMRKGCSAWRREGSRQTF